MFSVTALSLPDRVILRKVMLPTPIGVFVAMVALAIMRTGFLVNWFDA